MPERDSQVHPTNGKFEVVAGKFQVGEVALYVGIHFRENGISYGDECVIEAGFATYHVSPYPGSKSTRQTKGYIISFKGLKRFKGHTLFAVEIDLRKKPKKQSQDITEWDENLFIPKDLKVNA